jgi:hypothetical protein
VTPVIIGLVAATLAVAGQAASAKPNFSGQWKLDLSQSSFGPLPPPTSVTRSIKHAEPALEIVENQQSDLGDQTVSRNYRTDGTETMFTAQGAEVKGSAKWSDNMLVVVSTVDVAGLSFNDAMTLSADGKTLTSVVKMTTAQGDLDMKLVFVKQ